MESAEHLFLNRVVAQAIWGLFFFGMSLHFQALTIAHTLNLWWMQGSNRTLKGWLMYMLPL